MVQTQLFTSSELKNADSTIDVSSMAVSTQVRFGKTIIVLSVILVVAALISLWAGYRVMNFRDLFQDPVMQTVLFRLRLPRVLLAAFVGASLSVVGAALQAMFRNPLAEPFTLGVSGGGTLGASVAIALGWGASVSGVPLVFLTAFAGSGVAVLIVYRLSRSARVVLPGMILLA